MTDNGVLNILQTIQDCLLVLDRKIDTKIDALDRKIDSKIDTLDEKFTRQNAILAQDIRLVRAAILDMTKTLATKGEIAVLHEDMTRVQQGLAALTVRVQILESERA